MKKPGEKRVRLQLDLSAESQRVIGQLKIDTDAATGAEVVRHALRLLEWYVSIRQNGGVVSSVAPDGTTKELVFLID